MASSSSSVSSSSSSRPCPYDVFLSFRGESRNGFTNHLYYALRRNKIKTFIGDKLDKGKDLQVLLQAIEESAISIIIFSADFADSTWCLDEVVTIVDSMNRLGQTVLPVFLRIDPSDVTENGKSFSIAVDKHEEKAKAEKDHQVLEKIPRWKDALSIAASQCGWDSSVTGLDSKLVEEIVMYVLDALRKMSTSSFSRNLIGINIRSQKANSLLHIGSDDIRIVGLWGMGGIGKTTIAKTLYNQISRLFEACYFVQNVSIKAKKYGLDHLLREILSRILGEDAASLEMENNSLKTRLRQKKVLIVLDNVDDSLQLDGLLIGGHDSFGLGSKIIVISRELQVIKSAADDTYKVEELNLNESLQLFSLYAFKQNQPPWNRTQQSKVVVNYCQRNPLALKVLGSALYGRDEQDWESALDGLKKGPKPQILNVLRAGYDGLGSEEKKIFLDIACFFRGWDRDYVTEILESCYCSAYGKITVLIDKSLITIMDNDLEIHDLLQEMSWNIVREVSEPGKRSRLWDTEDIYHVLRNKKGTNAIEGIFLDTFNTTDMQLESDSFMGMDHLKILKVFGCDNLMDTSSFPSTKNHKVQNQPRRHLSFLSNELRYLYWSGFPFKSLPRKFNAENLVMLILPNSMVKHLWTGLQHLPKLKRINLERSRFLTEIPNLSKAENVAYINLARCESLVQLPSSIQHLKKLEHLNLYGCTKLRNLPSRIDSKLLRYFDLSYCPNVEKCPDVFGKLEELYLPGTAIEELPHSVVKHQLLRVLKLSNCSKLTKIPELPLGIEELNLFNTAIRELPQSFHELQSLRNLNLTCCSNLRKLPELPPGLLELNLSETAIKELPQSIHELKLLRVLNLTGCSNFTQLSELPPSIKELHLSGTAIEELPSSIQFLTRLVDLKIEACRNLSKLPCSITRLKSLKTLCFQDCPKLRSFPEILEPMGCLIDLSFHSCRSVMALPNSICRLKSLRTLQLHKCENLESFPEILEPMESLTLLRLSCCNNVKSLPNSISNLKSLERLHLEEVGIQELPSSFEKLQFLKHLILVNCENLVTLPRGIHKLFNCMEIIIKGCTKLRSLPALPPYLKRLGAVDCESLSTLSSNGGRNVTYMSFQNCFQLDQNACNFISDSIRRQIQFMAVKVPQHRHPIQCIGPGSEIPQWLNDQTVGSSVTIKFPSNQHQLKGIAFGVVVALKDPSLISTSDCWVERIICKCRAKTSNRGANEFIFRWATPFGLRVAKLDQLILCYEPCIEALQSDSTNAVSEIDNYLGTEVLFEFYPVDSAGQCNVKKCAVLLVEYDAEFWNYVLQHLAESLPIN